MTPQKAIFCLISTLKTASATQVPMTMIQRLAGILNWMRNTVTKSSTARYAIFPLQDLFGFGSDCRMNTPGAAAGNWAWRYTSDKLSPELAEALKTISEVYGRDRARMEVHA